MRKHHKIECTAISKHSTSLRLRLQNFAQFPNISQMPGVNMSATKKDRLSNTYVTRDTTLWETAREFAERMVDGQAGVLDVFVSKEMTITKKYI